MKTFIDSQIARTNRNFLLANLLLLIVVSSVLSSNSRYINNLLRGPVSIAPTNLLQVRDPQAVPRYYVSVTVDEIISTGVTQITKRTRNGAKVSETTDAAYYVLPLGDQYLLAKRSELNSRNERQTLIGSLESLSGDEQAEVIDAIEREAPELQGRFLPYKLDATPFAHIGHYIMLVTLVLVGGLGVFNLVRWIIRVVNKRQHPILQQLAQHGNLQQLIDDVNASLSARTKGKMATSPRWVASLTEFGVDLRPTQDLIWVHMTRTQHRRNGINAGKSFGITLYDRSGRASLVNFGRGERNASELMAQLQAAIPWAILGYSDDIAKLWQKDRAQLIQMVDQRRGQTA